MSTENPIQWGRKAVSPGVRRPERQADQSPRVIIVEAYTSTSPYLLAVCMRTFCNFLFSRSFCRQKSINVENDKPTAVAELLWLLDVGVDCVLSVWIVSCRCGLCPVGVDLSCRRGLCPVGVDCVLSVWIVSCRCGLCPVGVDCVLSVWTHVLSVWIVSCRRGLCPVGVDCVLSAWIVSYRCGLVVSRCGLVSYRVYLCPVCLYLCPTGVVFCPVRLIDAEALQFVLQVEFITKGET